MTTKNVIDKAMWESWLWQQQNALRSLGQVRKIFPLMSKYIFDDAEKWLKKGFRFLITPYVLSLVERDADGNPKADDPVWKQVFPLAEASVGGDVDVPGAAGPDEYSAACENWEDPAEMISPICQFKYDNRAIIFTGDYCLGYCNYCFRSLHSESETEKHGGKLFWQKTLEAIRKRPYLEEIILSGGDPLVLDNYSLGNMLADLRSIGSIKAIRIHTRAWFHNPFRIDREFCGLLKKYDVTEMGVHIIHPREITVEFKEAVQRVRDSGAKTMLMADIPLVKGINDNEEVLRRLFMDLYLNGVKPYYLSHNMPNIPAAGLQRTTVKRGLELMNSLKRKISNPAMPEYIITHATGKKTVPESSLGGPDFVYSKGKNGWPTVKFLNWKGDWVEYLDGKA